MKTTQRLRISTPAAVALAAWTLLTVHAGAQPCAVGGPAFPTVTAALADPGCSEIELSAGEIAERLLIGRSVVVRGDGAGATSLVGPVEVRGSGVTVTLQGLTIDLSRPGSGGCRQALLSTGGARLETADVAVRNTASGTCSVVLFADGFETGDALRWSTLAGEQALANGGGDTRSRLAERSVAALPRPVDRAIQSRNQR